MKACTSGRKYDRCKERWPSGWFVVGHSGLQASQHECKQDSFKSRWQERLLASAMRDNSHRRVRRGSTVVLCRGFLAKRPQEAISQKRETLLLAFDSPFPPTGDGRGTQQGKAAQPLPIRQTGRFHPPQFTAWGETEPELTAAVAKRPPTGGGSAIVMNGMDAGRDNRPPPPQEGANEGRRFGVHCTSGMILSARLRLRRMIEKSRRSVVYTVRMFSRSARWTNAASANWRPTSS
jgi:hypothetical protein